MTLNTTDFGQHAVVMYENDGVPILGAILSAKKDKFVILNDRDRTIELPTNRLQLLPGRIPSNLNSQKEISNFLESARKEAEVLMRSVNLEELWSLVHEDGGDYDVAFLCESYFGKNILTHHLAMRFALLNDRIYFKRGKSFFSPRAGEIIEELKHRDKIERQRAELFETSRKYFHNRKKDGSLPVPDEIKPLIENLTELAAKSNLQDSSSKKEAVDFLESCVEKNDSLIVPGTNEDRAYQLLNRIGIFNRATNLSFIRHGIRREFTTECLTNAEELSNAIKKECSSPSQFRKDLTHLQFITIDDPSTKDMDDALAIEDNGSFYTLYIAISDVASFVQNQTLIDKEARLRSTSIYSPESKVPMLPLSLSEDALSLVLNEPRCVLVAKYSVTKSFEIKESELFFALIKVSQRLSYNDVESCIKSGDKLIGILYQIALSNEAFRFKKGAQKIPKREAHVVISQDGEITVSEIDDNSPSRSSVGELMIIFNETVAKFCENREIPIPFRAQEPSDDDKGPVDAIPTGPAQDYASRFRLKRSNITFSKAPHATLGLDGYTQASSPIRRYLDLCIQRQIHSYITVGKPFYKQDEFERILFEIDEPLKTAMIVSRESKRYWLLCYLKDRQKRDPKIEGTVVRSDARVTLVELEEVFINVPVRVPSQFILGQKATFLIKSVDPKNDYIRLESES